ncbi:MAG: hypothetical protein RL660_2942 [Bacteroidota bacterium]
MQKDLNFSLYDIVHVAKKYYKHILAFAIVASIATAVYGLILKNRYRSYANFYPSNAMIASRDHLFRIENQDALDQFGFEHEQDRMITFGNCAPLMNDLVNKYNLYKHYGYDTANDPRAKQKTFKLFNKNYEVSKGSYGNVELNVTDEDANLASMIANDALVALQDKYREYYINSHRGIAEALGVSMKRQDSVINFLTDSLISIRKKYGVYDILSPSRKANITVRSTSAEGIELVQNVEELKDKYVADRARYESIQNEFKTAEHKSIPYIQVVQYPTPSGQKDGPFRTIMVLSAFAGSLVLGLLIAYAVEQINHFKQS